MVDRCRQMAGVERVTLLVVANNTPARRLYESMGFVVTSVEKDSYRVGDQSYDECRMDLEIFRD